MGDTCELIYAHVIARNGKLYRTLLQTSACLPVGSSLFKFIRLDAGSMQIFYSLIGAVCNASRQGHIQDIIAGSMQLKIVNHLTYNSTRMAIVS